MNEAIVEYQEALRLNPDIAEVHNNLGRAWGANFPGRRDDAIAQLETACACSPILPRPTTIWGMRAASGRAEDAIAEYQNGVAAPASATPRPTA